VNIAAPKMPLTISIQAPDLGIFRMRVEKVPSTMKIRPNPMEYVYRSRKPSRALRVVAT